MTVIYDVMLNPNPSSQNRKWIENKMKMRIKQNKIKSLSYDSNITVRSIVWNTYIVPARCQS